MYKYSLGRPQMYSSLALAFQRPGLQVCITTPGFTVSFFLFFWGGGLGTHRMGTMTQDGGGVGSHYVALSSLELTL